MAKKSKTNGSKRGRKSKAESMTGKKAAEVETRSPSLDLKPVEIDEADVNLHIRAIKAATEKKDTAVSLLRGANKAAAQVHRELPGAIKAAITAERDNDPEKLKAKLEVLGITLRATGSSVQLTVHDTLLGDVMESAKKRGHADGKAGKTADPRAPENSDLAKAYMDAWTKGTASNLGLSEDETEDALNPQPEGAAWPDDADVQRQPEHAH